MLTKEKEILFNVIETYRDMPYLWDKSHRNYRNQELRKEGNKILFEIYKEFDSRATVRNLVKKVQNLRTTFFKELRKVKSSIRSGAEPVYIPTLWYFEAMSFLASGRASEDLNDTEVKNSIRAEADRVYIPTLWYIQALSFLASERSSRDIKKENTHDHEDRSRQSDLHTTEYDDNSSTSSHRNEPIHVFPMNKKRRLKKVLKTEIDDSFTIDVSPRESKVPIGMSKEEDNECDLYAQLLAQKLKRIDEDQRLNTHDHEDRSRQTDLHTTEYDDNSSTSSHRNEPIHVFPMNKKRRLKKVLKTEIDDSFTIDVSPRESKVPIGMSKEEDNECDLYAQLLAQKLKRIDEDQRLVLMNEIDNLVFKSVMLCKAREPSSVFFTMVDSNADTEEV